MASREFTLATEDFRLQGEREEQPDALVKACIRPGDLEVLDQITRLNERPVFSTGLNTDVEWFRGKEVVVGKPGSIEGPDSTLISGDIG